MVDEAGKPVEVIVPWQDFCDIAEALGWDLDERAEADLRETLRDSKAGKREAFVPLSSL